MVTGRAALSLIASSTLWLAACSAPRPDAPPAFESGRISVVTRGSGPDVVLIPGLATSRDVWNATVAAVPGYRYHLVQVEGFAGTPPRANATPGPLLDPLAGEIVRYIVGSRLQRPTVVGHSLGGHLALMTAAALPTTVSRTMIVDTVPFGAMLFAGPAVTPAEAIRLGADTRARLFSGDFAASMQQVYPTMIRDPSLASDYARQASASDLDVSGRLFEEVMVTDLRPRLKAITGPVTVLYVGSAKMDPLYRAAYAALPQARLVHVQDSRHYVMLDQPDEFAANLKDFLQAAE